MKEFEIHFTEEERAKCRRVTEAFQEYFEEMKDTIVVDAGKFGYVWLMWFDGFQFDSQELFDSLWEAWKGHHLMEPVLGTPQEELDDEELYERLTAEEKEAFEKKREYFFKKAFG